MTEKRPVYPIHPGAVLGDELTELNITPADLARALHVPSNRLCQLVAGKRSMTADTALRLEQWLGRSRILDEPAKALRIGSRRLIRASIEPN